MGRKYLTLFQILLLIGVMLVVLVVVLPPILNAGTGGFIAGLVLAIGGLVVAVPLLIRLVERYSRDITQQ